MCVFVCVKLEMWKTVIIVIISVHNNNCEDSQVYVCGWVCVCLCVCVCENVCFCILCVSAILKFNILQLFSILFIILPFYYIFLLFKMS